MAHRLFYCDNHEIPLPPGHRFPIRKYALVRRLLAESGQFELVEAPFAERQDLELAHDHDFVEQFLAGTLPTAEMRRIGFPWSEGLVRRTLGSVGATLAATDEALNSGWGGSTSGGTHHAFRASGSGFCVFNDLAVAICRLRERRQVKRAAVIDLDVHQGDGTAEIFSGDANVLTTSVHCKVNFPFRKQQSDIDVELEVGTRDDEYLRVVDQLLPRVLDFEPEIIFYQAGVDGLTTDTLGKLSLSEEGLVERDRRVMTLAATHRIPLVVTLGGGYSEPIELTACAHANTYLTAVEVFAQRPSLAGD